MQEAFQPIVERLVRRLPAAGVEQHRDIVEILPVDGQADNQVGADALQPLLLFLRELQACGYPSEDPLDPLRCGQQRLFLADGLRIRCAGAGGRGCDILLYGP